MLDMSLHLFVMEIQGSLFFLCTISKGKCIWSWSLFIYIINILYFSN
jgi:hypothetical protein